MVNNFAAHPLTTEGEVQVDVLNGHCDTQTIVGALGAFGDLHTVQTYRNNDVSTVFAEFYDIRNAAAAINSLNGQQVDVSRRFVVPFFVRLFPAPNRNL